MLSVGPTIPGGGAISDGGLAITSDVRGWPSALLANIAKKTISTVTSPPTRGFIATLLRPTVVRSSSTFRNGPACRPTWLWVRELPFQANRRGIRAQLLDIRYEGEPPRETWAPGQLPGRDHPRSEEATGQGTEEYPSVHSRSSRAASSRRDGVRTACQTNLYQARPIGQGRGPPPAPGLGLTSSGRPPVSRVEARASPVLDSARVGSPGFRS